VAREPWSEWQVVQLEECYIRNIGPEETAALLGKSTKDVCEKARERGLLFSEDNPNTAPDLPEPFPKDIAAS
jgi:hypothetical protein